MVKTSRKYTIVLLSMFLVISMVMSSCNLFGGGSKAVEEVERVVDRYFTSIENGRLARDDYESDYAEDAPFADLDFVESVAELLMVDGMSRISFEIEEIEANARNKEASCDVLLSAVDVEKIISELGDSYSEEDFVDLFESEDAPMKDYEITLYLYYDDRDEEWIIEETVDVVDVLGQPYTMIEFSELGPQDVADSFLNALAQMDFDRVESLSYGYLQKMDFIDPDYDVAEELFSNVFGNMQFEMINEYLESGYAEYLYSITVQDFETPFYDVVDNPSFLIDAFEEVYYLFVAGPDDDTQFQNMIESAYHDFLSQFSLFVVSKINDSSDTISSNIYIELSYDAGADQWYVLDIDYDMMIFSDIFYNFDPMDYLGSDQDNYIASEIFDNLYNSGRIDEGQYNAGLAQFTDRSVEIDFDAEMVTQSILEQSWYDWSTWDYVEVYENDTNKLNYDLYFDTALTGLVLYCDFYADGGRTLLGTVEIEMESTSRLAEFIFDHPDGDYFEAGTYTAVIRMSDDSIIAESSINIT